LAEGLKEAVEEDLRPTLFVAGDVSGTPRSKFGEFFPARHDGVLHKGRGAGNAEFIGGGLVGIAHAQREAKPEKQTELI